MTLLQWFSPGSIWSPRKHLAMSGGLCEGHEWGGASGRGKPTGEHIPSYPPATKNYPAQNAVLRLRNLTLRLILSKFLNLI